MARTQGSKIRVTTRQAQGLVEVWAENRDKYFSRNFEMSWQRRENSESEPAFPLRSVLQPGQKKLLARIRPSDPKQSWAYSYLTAEGLGNPDQLSDDSLFLLPYAHGTKRLLSQAYFGVYTHQGMRALDFDMPEGTLVCAARDGVVADLRADSKRGGPSPAYADDANYIDILHGDGTWASYVHLRPGGVKVKRGQKVKAGQGIGYSGKTGQAKGPHLHFTVSKGQWGREPETVAGRFRLDEVDARELSEGAYYYAWHPDKPAFTREGAEQLDFVKLMAERKSASGGKFKFLEQSVDDVVLIYGANGMNRDIQVEVSLQAQGQVQPSTPLPLQAGLKAREQRLLFWLKLKPPASYRLEAKIRGQAP